MDGDSFARLIYLGLLLAAIGGWALVESRQRVGQTLRVLLAWGLIFIGVMSGYGLWNDLRQDIRPSQRTISANQIEVPRAQDGHYYLELEVNGHAIVFMADTGATNIVLSKADARAIGIDPAALVYLGEAFTANGVVRTARVTLESLTLGPFEDLRVAALVNEGEMDGSLLGMDYLGRFAIELTGDRMILKR